MSKPGAPYRSVSQVAPRLYMGAKPPNGDTLARLGFTMVVFCAEEHQPPDADFPGVRVVRVPLTESESVQGTLQRVGPVADVVAAEVRRGGQVLVTCRWGYNRSGVTTALALRRLQPSVPPGQIVARIRAVRPAYRGLHALGISNYVRAVER
jgi:hypothetical protein